MKLRYKITGGILIFLVITISSLALVLSHNSACPPAPTASAETELMKAVVYRCYGSPEVLRLEDVAKPKPLDDEVLVKVHAASVNPLDWHYMRGSPYIMRLGSGVGAPDDTSMGVDFSGTVEAVGSKVTRFKPGDEVFGGRGGAFAEYVTVRENRALALKPENITFEQAASVPMAKSPDQWCVGRRGYVCGADRQVIRCGGDRRLQYPQRGHGPFNRCRSRVRLHP
jgi:threonine dehydrogenase-like Zn-dependent dehydrogenase